jgi:multidrug efflux pump
LFLPALYVAWFRIYPVHDDGRPTPEAVDLTQHAPSSERVAPQNEPAPVLETQF